MDHSAWPPKIANPAISRVSPIIAITSALTARLLIFVVIGVDQMIRTIWTTSTTSVVSAPAMGVYSQPNSGNSATWARP
nr:hypothetical protein [Microbispora sp. GKU 823]